MTTMTATGGRERPAGGFELTAWLFMRVSGVLLLFLALGHLATMHLINTVDDISFVFVVGRFSDPVWGPFWRIYDWLLLTLALLHGMNGLRNVVDDLLRPSGWRVFLKVVAYSVAVFCGIAGSYVVFVWQPGS